MGCTDVRPIRAGVRAPDVRPAWEDNLASYRRFVHVLAFLLSTAITACTSASPTTTPVPSPTPEETVIVDRVEVVILESFPVRVQAIVHGTLPDACAFIERAEQVRRDNVFEVTITPAWQANARCAPGRTPFEHTVPLDVAGLPAGTYVVEVHGARGTFALSTPSIPLEPAMVAGRVWHDLCAITGGEGGVPASPSEGCVPDAGGGYRANGLMEQGEPGIEGVVVSLGQGECPAAGLQTVLTDPDGRYTFPDLDPGTYCASVDPLQEPNTSVLVPGGWTAPDDRGAVTVELSPGTQRMDVNFGWDYQFLPADALAEFEARLIDAVSKRDAALMAQLMDATFVIAAWRSEGGAYPRQDAVAQLLESHLSGNASSTFDWERDPTTLIEGADPHAFFGPEVHIARVLLVTGWGTQGRDEALLFVAQLPDGSYAWYGILTALGGFAPQPPALNWHREGGIAGFCDDLGLYANGNVYARSCKAGPLQSGIHARLSGERLAQLEAWIGSLCSFGFEQSTGAVADAMTVRLTFQGMGTGEASQEQVEAMLDLASQIFAEL
jgi:hypothetical protein